ncbi:MAG: hypothetical protein M3Q96_06855 [Pseudomonadota bacterium]|nr:hypothetical protein [Pseudomonadota bacterium]
MRPALLMSCILAGALIACSRESAPANSESPASAAPASTSPTPAPVKVAPADPVQSATTANAPLQLALSGEGLDFVSGRGSVRHLVFDTPATAAIDAVTRAHGGVAPQLSRNEECGAGPLDMATWPNGLTVMSQDDRFVGWSVSRGAADGGNAGLATMAGIGFGSTRRELEAAYAANIRETTLGEEFVAGDVFGVLDGTGPSARITAMWAGASCNFR